MSDTISNFRHIAEAADCGFNVVGADKLTTFKGGGSAPMFAPYDLVMFVKIYGELTAQGYCPYVMGAGSNTVIADGVTDTPVISTCMLCGTEYAEGLLYAECGVKMSDVTKIFRQNGYGGFEFLSGVPATVGGAVKMNASAFLSQTADYIYNIVVLTSDNGKIDIISLDGADIDFAYRKGVDGIVLSATLKADTSLNRAASLKLSRRYLAQRRAKQPMLPSCGSVFKNGAQPSGKLIEECGLKGRRSGGAQISEKHANFIVNTGGATADDFMSLVRLCECSVYEKFGLTLEREFVYLE